MDLTGRITGLLSGHENSNRSLSLNAFKDLVSEYKPPGEKVKRDKIITHISALGITWQLSKFIASQYYKIAYFQLCKDPVDLFEILEKHKMEEPGGPGVGHSESDVKEKKIRIE